LKLLQGNIGKTLQDINIGDDFLKKTSIVQEIIAIKKASAEHRKQVPE
jgi:hypothetical protein